MRLAIAIMAALLLSGCAFRAGALCTGLCW